MTSDPNANQPKPYGPTNPAPTPWSLLWWVLIVVAVLIALAVLNHELFPKRGTTVDYQQVNRAAQEQACLDAMRKSAETPLGCEQYDYTRKR